MKTRLGVAAAACLALLLTTSTAGQEAGDQPPADPLAVLATAFTYQGRLSDGGNPATGSYDLQLKVFDSLGAGSQVGSTVLKNNVTVSDGLFTADLDFSASVFTGQALWLEIAVRPGASSGAYAALSPRQPLNPAPFTHYAKAGVATDVQCAGCVGSTDLAAGAVGVDRLAAGSATNGQVLTATGVSSMAWQASPSAPVASVFGRTGAVVGQAGDYAATQVSNAPAGGIAATTVQTAVNELDTEKAALAHTHTAAGVTGLSPGGVLFGQTGGSLAQDAARLFWDQTNKRLGLGLATPSALLHLKGAASQAAALQIDPYDTLAGATGQLRFAELAANGTNVTGFKAPDVLASDLVYTLPSTSADGVLRNAAGVLAWDPSGGGGDGPVSSVFGRTGAIIAAAGDYAGSQVSNAPAGGVAATNVQAAINELDTEKAATGHTQAATTVTNAPAGGIAAATVQAAINELDTEKAAISHTQAATTVTNAPAGGIAAATVQAAINELDTEKAASGHTHAGGAITGLTAGGITFGTASGTLGQAASTLFWDETNSRLGLGTGTPAEQLSLTGNLSLPTTTSTAGQVKLGGQRWLHAYGADNTFLGVAAGNTTTSGGGSNTGIGGGALAVLSSGTSNTAVGRNSLQSVSTGAQNTAVGASSLWAVVGGSENTAVGTSSLGGAAGISQNTAVGAGAGGAATGNRNVFIGYNAGHDNTFSDRLYINNSATDPPLVFGDFASGRLGVRTTNPGQTLSVKGTLGVANTGDWSTILQAASGQASNITYTLPATRVDGLLRNSSGTLSWDSGAGSVSSVFARTGDVVADAGDYTASQVTNVAAGGISATTVQAALNELDGDKSATNHTHTATGVTGLTSGGVLFANASGNLAQNAGQLFWDTTNNRLGIGTNSPQQQLEISKNMRLPATSLTGGVVYVGASTFLHGYGVSNTFLGANAGNLSLAGDTNVAVGTDALNAIISGSANTAVGNDALTKNTLGASNTAVGSACLDANIDGAENTAVGVDALGGNLDGDQNTAIGNGALLNNWHGINNTAVGVDSLYSSKGDHNTALGANALNLLAAGTENVAVGVDALHSGTNLTGCVALGYSAGYSNTANDRLFIANSSASPPLIYGEFDNARVGLQTTTPANTLDVKGTLAVGSYAGSTAAPTNGLIVSGKVGVATNSPDSAFDVAGNVSLGTYGGTAAAPANGLVVSGSTGIGTSSPLSKLDVNGGVAVGSYAGVSAAPSSSLIVSGQVGIGTDTPLAGTKLDVNGLARVRTLAAATAITVCRTADGTLAACSSDARLKANVRDLTSESDVLGLLARLRAVRFEWDRSVAPRASKGTELGMIAQEVEAVLPELVAVEADGYRSMDYGRLSAFLVEVAKAQQARLGEQQGEIETQRAAVEQRDARIDRLESLVAELVDRITAMEGARRVTVR